MSAREPRTEGRVVRKSLLESERWLTLKDNADRLAYISLLLNCDDYGNFSGERYRLMRMWRDFGINTVEFVSKTLSELLDHDLIGLYDVEKRPFLHVHRLHNTRQWWTRIYPKSPFDEDKDNPTKQRVSEISINHVLDHHKPGVRGKGLGEVQKQKHTGAKSRASKTLIKDNFSISDNVMDWALTKGIFNLDAHFECFVNTCKAKGYQYADWDRAFMNAAIKDWAKIGKGVNPAQPKKVAW